MKSKDSSNNIISLWWYLPILVVLFYVSPTNAQIAYDSIGNKNISLGSYGRVGVDWSFDSGRTIGRRLNLNNMGSIGGRLEEQDYLEIAPSFHFKPKKGDNTVIHAQLRLSLFSNSLTTFANSTTSSLGGLTIALPEIFVQARNIAGKDLNVWVGARLYRGPDVHIADHFYFNDHSGQGFGIEYKNTRFVSLFISSTDTTATVPPYFYLNIKTGTPNAALRQRTLLAVEHDFNLNDENTITVLGEYHRMPDGDEEVKIDSIEEIVNFPSDYGFVLGARHHVNIKKMKEGSFNDFSIRYGTRIANGGDGGMSRTWFTYGAPDTISLSFNNAYSLAIVNQTVLNFSDRHTLNPYLVFTMSKGGADTNGKSKTYFGKEVYNRKFDFTVGARDEIYLSDIFHLLLELHYFQRKDGENPFANVIKFSIAPVYVPTGKKDYWARPHLQFVATVARYNDYAMEALYSPFLEFTSPNRWAPILELRQNGGSGIDLHKINNGINQIKYFFYFTNLKTDQGVFSVCQI